MIIRVTMSGGFAGLDNQEVGFIDTSNLDKDTVTQIEKQLARLSDAGKTPIGADLLRYSFKIQDESGVREIVVSDEGDLDSPVQKLLALL